MAWRIEQQVLRGEIDNRAPGRVIGKIWLAGRDEAVELELEGNPWRDLAGHVLKFTNPAAKPGDRAPLSAYQQGMVGDMTASRKVRIPDVSMEELMDCYTAKQPFPWHWGNSLYLEWYSHSNGRVVIEAAHYQLELDVAPAWILTEAEEMAQQAVNAEALAKFMERLGIAMTDVHVKYEDEDDDLPQSLEEAQADAEEPLGKSCLTAINPEPIGPEMGDGRSNWVKTKASKTQDARPEGCARARDQPCAARISPGMLPQPPTGRQTPRGRACAEVPWPLPANSLPRPVPW